MTRLEAEVKQMLRDEEYKNMKVLGERCAAIKTTGKTKSTVGIRRTLDTMRLA